ncbi:MAG: 5-oxoprolinase subunit PxpB [Gemmatimonadaceae bacterium]
MEAPRTEPLGDSAVTIMFGTERSPELLKRVHSAAASLLAASIADVKDVVPAYLSVAVFYDSLQKSYGEIAPTLLAIARRTALPAARMQASRAHDIPVVYDGPDLDLVASALGLTTEEVVARHLAGHYSVDLIGFVPGFAYLSGLDPALHLPRRTQPRPRVPAGSVAIAGAQTGVYPLDTPGGWHIIGRTDAVMFDPVRDPPALLRAGDTARFALTR